MAKIHIIGVGPGSPDYVTPIARKTVQKAKVVVGAERALNLFQNDIKGEKITLTAKNFQEAVAYAIKQADKGLEVAFLSTGDPCFSGLLRPVLKIVGENADVNVVPGISAIQACAARLKICWDEADLISFHEGADFQKKKKLAESAKKGKPLIILPDPKAFTPSDIARFLISEGAREETPVFICENLTLEEERVFSSSLTEIMSRNFSSLCVMVVKPP
ncbi:MAG: precorrin-6y C5,15-methyltransferase (decarboxylating) subunit CbiE [Candidatus Bathyarchaeales archaeon]